MDALFVEEPVLGFEKVAQVGKVGDDEKLWPQEVLDLFFEQHPYLADAEATPVLTNTNDERGYAVGAIVVRKKPMTVPRDVSAEDVTKEIRFPLVIREKNVSPFDVFVVGESFHPATAHNVERAVFRPEAFDITRVMPGDTSLVNQIYPPYRSRYGFGTSFESGGKTASVLDQILPMLSPEDLQRLDQVLGADANLLKTAKAHAPLRKALAKLAGAETVPLEEMEAARRRAIHPDVLQFKLVGNQVQVKAASRHMYAPYVDTLSVKEAAEILPATLKDRLMSEGGVTVSTDPVVRQNFEENKAVVIKNHGVYEIHRGTAEDKGYRSAALVYTSVVDFNMTSLPVTLAVFFNSDWALQDQIAGIPATRDLPDFIDRPLKVRDFLPSSRTPSSFPEKDKSYSTVEKALAMPRLGTVSFASDKVATIPVTIKSVRISGNDIILNAMSSFDEPLELIPTSGIRKIESLGQRRYAIPTDLRVLRLGQLVKARSQPEQYVKIASGSVEIISDGSVYKFRGHPSLAKLAQPTDFLDHNDAMFLSVAFGMKASFADQMLKRAAKDGSVLVQGVAPIVTEREKLAALVQGPLKAVVQKVTAMRHDLLKEAAVLPGEDTVDKVLSLNFITPENVSIFTQNLPSFVETGSDLAKLLIGIRLGLENIPEGAVQRAMNSLQGVIESLQELEYNKPIS